MIEEEQSWRTQAACRTHPDPDLWFPSGETVGAGAQRQIQQAKAVCRQCPVQFQCLEEAIEQGIAEGVWGGRTWKERAQLQHQRHQAQAASEAGQLSELAVQQVMTLLDRGVSWSKTAKRTGIPKSVCWSLWQQLRPHSPRRGPDRHGATVSVNRTAS